jgi:hypothetical protein
LAGVFLLSNGGWSSSDVSAGQFDEGRRLSGIKAIAPNGPVACAAAANDGAGNVVGAMLLAGYMFIGLAIVCDEFFQPALEKISEVRTHPFVSITPVC